LFHDSPDHAYQVQMPRSWSHRSHLIQQNFYRNWWYCPICLVPITVSTCFPFWWPYTICYFSSSLTILIHIGHTLTGVCKQDNYITKYNITKESWNMITTNMLDQVQISCLGLDGIDHTCHIMHYYIQHYIGHMRILHEYEGKSTAWWMILSDMIL